MIITNITTISLTNFITQILLKAIACSTLKANIPITLTKLLLSIQLTRHNTTHLLRQWFSHLK